MRTTVEPPLMATSPQGPLSSVPKVAVVERFYCVLMPHVQSRSLSLRTSERVQKIILKKRYLKSIRENVLVVSTIQLHYINYKKFLVKCLIFWVSISYLYFINLSPKENLANIQPSRDYCDTTVIVMAC